MIQITRLPEEVKRFFEPLRARFSYRHFLVFCWLIAAHLVCFEKATCKALGRYTPKHVGWWHLRRLLACGRWPWEEVLYWLVTQALVAFPPPEDGVLYLVVDSTLEYTPFLRRKVNGCFHDSTAANFRKLGWRHFERVQ